MRPIAKAIAATASHLPHSPLYFTTVQSYYSAYNPPKVGQR